MIVSNATIYPRESNENNKKNQHMDDSHQEEVQSCELAQLQIINAHPCCLWLFPQCWQPRVNHCSNGHKRKKCIYKKYILFITNSIY